MNLKIINQSILMLRGRKGVTNNFIKIDVVSLIFMADKYIFNLFSLSYKLSILKNS